MRQMPPYFDPRTMPYDQTGRFPGPRMQVPGENMQRFPGIGEFWGFVITLRKSNQDAG